jgi:OOP family OmpA-OmpF porin
MSGTSVGGKVFLGYQFNRYFALEGSVIHLGTTTETYAPPNSGLQSDTRPMVAGFVHAIGTVPISSGFTFLGRLGAGITSDSAFSAVGLGLEYGLSRTLGARVEYEQFYGNGGPDFLWHTGLLSASVVYYFRK